MKRKDLKKALEKIRIFSAENLLRSTLKNNFDILNIQVNLFTFFFVCPLSLSVQSFSFF